MLVVEDGQVDAYTPSGNLLGVFRDRIEAVEAVVQNAALCSYGLLEPTFRQAELATAISS